MTLKEVVKILETEKQCVERQTCDMDCAQCNLVLTKEEVLEAYSMAIGCVQRFALAEPPEQPTPGIGKEEA